MSALRENTDLSASSREDLEKEDHQVKVTDDSGVHSSYVREITTNTQIKALQEFLKG